MITITDDFYLVLICKWDIWNVITLKVADNINGDYIMLLDNI